MKKKHGIRARLLLAPALLAGAPAAFAGSPQIDVTFGPASVSVPALDAMALVALSLLLAVVAWRVLGGGKRGAAAAVVLAGAGLAAGGVGIERSVATSSFSVTSQGDCETGGSYVIFERDNEFTNDCPNPMTILGYEFVDPQDTCTLVPNTSGPQPACIVGQPVAAGGVCKLAICDSPPPI